MLHTIRSRIKSVLVFLLFGLLIASFLLWGIEGFRLGNSNEPPVASVGSKEIDRYAFAQAYQQEIELFRQRLSPDFDSEQARALGLDRFVLSREISDALLNLGADDLGLAVSDRLVAQAIKSNPQFQSELTGQFDPGRFQSFLQSRGLSEAAQADRLRYEMARELYRESLSAAAVAPRVLAMALVKSRGERRRADLVAIAPATVDALPVPDDAALNAYLEANGARFMAPEYRQFSYLSLRAQDLLADVEVPEELLVETYEARREEFNSPEIRGVEQMVLKTQEAAAAAAKRLADGEEFAMVAKDLLGLEASDLVLGRLSRDDLQGDLGAVAFATPLGKNSPPVESPLGWHIVRVTAIEPSVERGVADVRAELSRELALEMAEDELYEAGAKLADLLGGGVSLEEAARELGLSVVDIDAVDGSGKDPQGNAVANLVDSPLLLKTAFGLAESEMSNLIDAGDDGYFVMRLEAVRQAAVPPLDQIRDRVAAAWSEDEKTTAILDKAAQLLEQAEAGTPLDVVAAQVGQVVRKTGPVTREGKGLGSDLPRAVADALFRVKQGALTTSFADGTAYIIRVTGVEAPEAADVEDALTSLKEQLRQSLAQDLLQQLIAALESKHEVNINQDVIDSVL